MGVRRPRRQNLVVLPELPLPQSLRKGTVTSPLSNETNPPSARHTLPQLNVNAITGNFSKSTPRSSCGPCRAVKSDIGGLVQNHYQEVVPPEARAAGARSFFPCTMVKWVEHYYRVLGRPLRVRWVYRGKTHKQLSPNSENRD